MKKLDKKEIIKLAKLALKTDISVNNIPDSCYRDFVIEALVSMYENGYNYCAANFFKIQADDIEFIKKLIVIELTKDYSLESSIEQVNNSIIKIDSVSNEINITYDNGVKDKYSILFPMTLIQMPIK